MAIDLISLSGELTTLVDRASAAIVSVHGRRGMSSSGIAWKENLVLTSSEGVRMEEGIKLLLPDGRTTTARLRGRDSGTDLALLETEGAGLPTSEFATDDTIKTGQLAVAVGRTANTGPIASFGMVSGVAGEWKTWRGGKIDPFVRLDLGTYPTLSGGAVLDVGGNLIGMVSTGLSRSSVFAVTRRTIERIAGRLSQHGHVSRGFLGAAVQPVELPVPVQEGLQQQSGIMLIGLEPDGPAATGGLILGDVLISGQHEGSEQALAQPEMLAELMERTPAGQTVLFRILRAGVLQQVDVRLGERPNRRR